jgi:hypothetical protein
VCVDYVCTLELAQIQEEGKVMALVIEMCTMCEWVFNPIYVHHLGRCGWTRYQSTTLRSYLHLRDHLHEMEKFVKDNRAVQITVRDSLLYFQNVQTQSAERCEWTICRD